ncbi:hypothetical protein F4775DRAFT_596290 [Biscogniauxia sp. FL1348]|nr:hypothetical protein F4775DRAFT_596290 [Biscogniauxia sp. FL1348]
MSEHRERDCHTGNSSSSSSSGRRSVRSTSNARGTQAERSSIRNEIFHTEPAAIPTPHREIQTQAIRAYHDHALSTRTSEHIAELRRARERRRAEQPQSSESSRSDTNTSTANSESDESGSGSSRRKTSRISEHYNPKYLVRGLLKSAFRSRSSPSTKSKNEGRESCSNHDSFFPTPKITFLIDQPDNLTCQICHETALKMGLSSEDAKETTPAILACGHVACSSCLDLWLEANHNCPFCRQEMTYSSCGHEVEPRIIAHDTIHSIPRTLADGGKIGTKCGSCRAKAQRNASLQKWQELAEEFKTARQAAESLKTDEAVQAMKKAQRAFERVPFDHSYDALALSISTW